jgi:prolyl oligopeptidase
LAASLSKGGNESGTVWVWEVATGKKLADSIPRVNGGTAGGSLAWNADSTGFYYTRYPRAGERPEADLDFYQQVYFHKLGTPTEKDTYSVGKEFPRIAEIVLTASEDGRWVLARVANGDGGEFAFYVRPPGGAWTPIAAFADKLIDARFGRDQALYLLSRKGAPRGALLRLPLASLKLAKATVVVPESDGVIESYQPTATRLFVAALVGGPSELRAYGLDGKPQGIIATAPVSAVRQLVSSKGDELYFPVSSYLVPRTWYRLAPLATKAEPTALAPKSPVDFSQVEVLRETATSKDGTKVPMTILRKKGIRLDGSNPVMLEGYGGFNISLGPVFDPTFGLWFDHGGVYAVANLRGGGEYGEAWHLAGSGVHKQNVFDDFLACARRLIELKYTSPARLAIRGGSNGGLLMGAAMVQAPELFRAVVSIAGTYDMLRVELEANGAFNVTEFGTVKDPEQFKALYAYSPYHHVKDGVSYPALLMVNGANDTRVEPMSSRKFTARLQAASGLVLLRTPADFGHAGASLEEAIDLSVEIYTFLFDQLGMK